MMNKFKSRSGVNAIEHRPEMHHKRRSMREVRPCNPNPNPARLPAPPPQLLHSSPSLGILLRKYREQIPEISV